MTKVRKISAKEAREEFSKIINQAAYGANRTVVTRHGKEVAAIIPISDLERLHDPDGGILTEEVRRAFKEEEKKNLEEMTREIYIARGILPAQKGQTGNSGNSAATK